MCGIVFVGGANLLETHLGFFDSMLHADVVRGKHSTGVFRGYENGVTGIYKEAVPGPVYLETAGYKALRGENNTKFQRERLEKEGKVVPDPVGNFYVGHNRYATQGAINSRNAHPFKHGNITLVHNGTLRGQYRLPDHADYEVDSENICHSINKIGIDETVQKLQGAFTLVWHNEEDQTLNFIRNTERPFYLLEFTSGMWAGASEEEMIKWLNNRRKASLSVKQGFELPVGEQYVFDVSKGGFKLKEVRKHKLPTFPYSYASQRAWWEDEDYYATRYGAPQQQQKKETKKPTPQSEKGSSVADANTQKINGILESTGISEDYRKGKVIHFWPYEFREYLKAEPDRGSVRGWTMDRESIYLEVEIHAMTRQAFNDLPSNQLCETTIISAYFENSKTKDGAEVSVAVAIGRNIAVCAEPPEDDIDLDDIDVEFLDLTGVELSVLNDDTPPFDLLTDRCEICNGLLEEGNIFVEEDDDLDTQVFCHVCNDHYGLRGTLLVGSKPVTEEEKTFDIPLPVPTTVVAEQESSEKEVPVVVVDSGSEEGGDSATVPKKTLLNGWCISQKEWELDVGFCGFCNESLPWEEAETTEMLYQSQPCCEKHYNMLMGGS